MSFSSRIELDEFDEMAFGISPQNASSGNNASIDRPSAEDPLRFLNNRDPPPLRLATSGAATAPPASSGTKMLLDGLFSDEEDDNDVLPGFQRAPVPESVLARPSTFNRQDSDPFLARDSGVVNRPLLSAPGVSRVGEQLAAVSVASSVLENRSTPAAAPRLTLGSLANSSTVTAGVVNQSQADSSSLTAKMPVKSNLFRNLGTPPWERTPAATPVASVLPERPPESPAVPVVSLTDRAEAERQRRSMIFGGSAPNAPNNPTVPNQLVPSQPTTTAQNTNITPSVPSQTPKVFDTSDVSVSKLLEESKQAEDEDHRRISSHYEFVRQQTQHAAQLQQLQTDDFFKQYLAENKKQLDMHLQRLKSGMSFVGPSSFGSELMADPESSVRTVSALEQKVQGLERKLEDRDEQLNKYNDQIMALEELHRNEMREVRARYEETLQRATLSHQEFTMTLQNNHESFRKQQEEALETLRGALTSKTSLDAVRGTLEQSATEFTVWRSEVEHKHESALRERELKILNLENQVRDLTGVIARQTENFKLEKEVLQKRIQEDTSRLLKREGDVEEQLFNFQRERLELEAERTRFRTHHTRELQRLEQRMDEALQEKQRNLDTLADDKRSVDEEKRKLSETIRGIEDKVAQELKRKQLNLESAMETVIAEKRLLDEKIRNAESESVALKDGRHRLERDKQDLLDRKQRLDKYNEELQRREIELDQIAVKNVKLKQDGERAFQEAQLIDVDHRNRVAKLNTFLEQLREKELSLIRKAVETDVDQRQRAVQLPNGSLALVPHRTSNNVRIQLVPNPARDQQFWQGENVYLQAANKTPWSSRKPV